MFKESRSLSGLPQFNWLKIFIVLTLAIGIFFRFTNIDKKFYWSDETLSSLRVSGYRMSEVEQALLDGKVMDIKNLDRYQVINNEKGLIDTIKSVIMEEGHPPLYYVILRFWSQCFGSSVGMMRSLSAVMSLLAFPCIYWLCQELFKSSLVGWISIALLAVSPFFVLYAQEARSYSLWTVTILLSSAALLRAIRLKTNLSWGVYAIILVLGLYSHLFTIFTAIGQGIYVFLTERFRLTKTLISYLLASLVSLLAFSPWILVIIITNLSLSTAPLNEYKPLSFIIPYWFYNVSYVFIDFFYVFVDFPQHYLNWNYGKILIPLLLTLIIYSIYFLIRKTPQAVWLFILITLIAIPALAVILPDLIGGGYRSIMGRYFTSCYIGILLSVAYLLAQKINSPSLNTWQKKGWKLILVVLISGGILSCAISSQSETWWNKRAKYPDLQSFKIINSANKPLVLTTSIPGSLVFNHVLNSKVKILVINSSDIPEIPDEFSNVFLLEEPSQYLKDELENKKNYKIEKVYEGRKAELWKIRKKSS
jgi:uncharacterized membrane protein